MLFRPLAFLIGVVATTAFFPGVGPHLDNLRLADAVTKQDIDYLAQVPAQQRYLGTGIAVLNMDLKMLKWLHDKDYPIMPETVWVAIGTGNVEIMDWLHSVAPPLEARAAWGIALATPQHRGVGKWLGEHGYGIVPPVRARLDAVDIRKGLEGICNATAGLTCRLFIN